MAFRMFYRMVSPFLDNKIKAKVTMVKEHTHCKLAEMVHPSQLEEKYGGEAENLTSYWPPTVCSRTYGYDENLVKDESVAQSLECSSLYEDDDSVLSPIKKSVSKKSKKKGQRQSMNHSFNQFISGEEICINDRVFGQHLNKLKENPLIGNQNPN